MGPHPFLKGHPADPGRPFGAPARILFDDLHAARHLFHEPDGGVVRHIEDGAHILRTIFGPSLLRGSTGRGARSLAAFLKSDPTGSEPIGVHRSSMGATPALCRS